MQIDRWKERINKDTWIIRTYNYLSHKHWIFQYVIRIIIPSIKLEHLVSFSDAIFAFAITIMTLSVDIPDLPTNLTQSELLDKLYDLYPQLKVML